MRAARGTTKNCGDLASTSTFAARPARQGFLRLFVVSCAVLGFAACTKPAEQAKAPAPAPEAQSVASQELPPGCRPASSTAAKVHGVIEIGSSGIKPTVVELDQASATELLDGETGKSGARYQTFDSARLCAYTPFDTRLATPSSLNDAAREVAGFLGEMEKQYGLAPSDVYMIASSGVAKMDHFTLIQETLAQAAKRQPSDIKSITAEQECQFTFSWIVPNNLLDQALVIDIGSGNTKACDSSSSQEVLAVGTKKYEQNVQLALAKAASGSIPELAPCASGASTDQTGMFACASDRLRAAEVTNQVKAPTRSDHQRVYFIGGAPWAAAMLTHPAATMSEPWVALTIDDFNILRDRTVNGTALTEYKNDAGYVALAPDAREAADKEAGRILGDVFTPTQLIAGIDILRSIVDHLRAREPALNDYAFSTEALSAWPSYYLLSQVKNSVPATSPSSAGPVAALPSGSFHALYIEAARAQISNQPAEACLKYKSALEASDAEQRKTVETRLMEIREEAGKRGGVPEECNP